uniref:MADF domain-containing protein n=1 Tax=Lutzomyia longipalpis TaxID=7200 RepID=A0A1B0GI82_LUTLO
MVRHREHQENVRLVRLVKQNPCLYDFGMSEYSDREHIEKHKNVRDKWRNLRTVFLRKLKAEQNGQTLKCRYYLMDEMKFIMPFVKMTVPYQIASKQTTTDEEVTLDTSKNTDEDEEATTNTKRRIRSRRLKPVETVEEPRECEEYEVVLEEPFPQSSTASDSEKKKLIRSLIHEIDTENETYSINYGEVKTQKRKYSSSDTEKPTKDVLAESPSGNGTND